MELRNGYDPDNRQRCNNCPSLRTGHDPTSRSISYEDGARNQETGSNSSTKREIESTQLVRSESCARRMICGSNGKQWTENGRALGQLRRAAGRAASADPVGVSSSRRRWFTVICKSYLLYDWHHR